MKLKLIALAALLAAGTAQAKIADSNDNTATSGDLFASVVSASNNASFAADLGIRLDQFMAAPVNAAGVKLVWDFDNNSFSDLSAVSTGLTTQTLNYGSIFSTFGTAAVLGASDLKFDVKAMDGLPTAFAAAGANRYLSTSSDASIAASNAQVFNMDAGGDPYVNALNADSTHSTHGTDLNTAGANMFDAGDSPDVYFQNTGDQWKGQVSFTSTGSAANPLNFFYLTNSGSGVGAANITKLDGQWSFDGANAQLTYMTAPIPEAETYAMMLAGLGLVGFMAGRRNKRV